MAASREPLYTLAATVIPSVVTRWVRLDHQGLEHIPRSGPVIIAANHTSYFDPLALGSFLTFTGRKVRFLAKAELFRMPLVGQILKGAGQIPVDRQSRDASKSLEAAVAELRDPDGGLVVVYPEGTTTRNADFSPMPAKNGITRLALLSGAPIVPVGIWGAHLLFTRHRMGPFRRGIRVVVRAGEPIRVDPAAGASREALKVETDRIMARVVGLVDEARTGWSPPPWYRRRSVAS